MAGEIAVKIFISHATSERLLGERLLDALVSAGIPKNEIFFSSRYHNGVELGEEIDSTIRKALQDSEVVILLLSRSFYQSEYCMNEVGAAWALEKPIAPILTDGLRIEDMKGFINGSRIAFRPASNSPDDLLAFLKDHLSISVNQNHQLDEFVDAAREYVNNRFEATAARPISNIEKMILRGSLTDSELILLSYFLDQEDPQVLDDDEFNGCERGESEPNEQAQRIASYFQQYGYSSYESPLRTLERSGLITELYPDGYYSNDPIGFELNINVFRDLLSMSEYSTAQIESAKARRKLSLRQKKWKAKTISSHGYYRAQLARPNSSFCLT